MGRIRTIKPEWLEDERLLEAGSDARVMSIALILLSDDYGRGRANDRWLGGQVFAFENDGHGKVRECLAALSGWFLNTYEVRGQKYFEIVNWSKHQRVDKPGKPHVPEPPRDTPGNVPETPAPDQDQDQDQDPDQDPDAPRAAAGIPGPTLRDVAACFRNVTGHDFPSDIDTAWNDRDERQPARRMLAWCGGDMAKLEAQLRELAQDKWLPGQPIDAWAKRIGTKRSGGGKTFEQRLAEQKINEH